MNIWENYADIVCLRQKKCRSDDEYDDDDEEYEKEWCD